MKSKNRSMTLDKHTTTSIHVYEIRSRTDKRGVDLTGDVLLLGRLWYGEPNRNQ